MIEVVLRVTCSLMNILHFCNHTIKVFILTYIAFLFAEFSHILSFFDIAV